MATALQGVTGRADASFAAARQSRRIESIEHDPQAAVEFNDRAPYQSACKLRAVRATFYTADEAE